MKHIEEYLPLYLLACAWLMCVYQIGYRGKQWGDVASGTVCLLILLLFAGIADIGTNHLRK